MTKQQKQLKNFLEGLLIDYGNTKNLLNKKNSSMYSIKKMNIRQVFISSESLAAGIKKGI